MTDSGDATKLELALTYPEGPRWCDGALWFSEFSDRTINRLTPGGDREVVLRLEDTPSGLGFMPDGSLLFVSMARRQLLRWSGGAPRLHADLGGLPGEFLNDMWVDDEGRAYVGARSRAVSPAVFHRDPGGPDCVIAVEPDGRAWVAADGLCSPNGTVISPDGAMVVLAETYARRVVRFDRDAAGRLSGRRQLIQFGETWPDGVCLDAEGAVWVCSPYSSEVVRVTADGEVACRWTIPGAVACALGGADGRTLFVVAVDTRWLSISEPGAAAQAQGGGGVYTVRVSVGAANGAT